MELLVAKLGLLLEAQTDKIAGVLFLIVAPSYGSLFLLDGIVLLIHLWQAWWLSFLITGAAIVIAGVFFQMTMKAAARKKEARAPSPRRRSQRFGQLQRVGEDAAMPRPIWRPKAAPIVMKLRGRAYNHAKRLSAGRLI